MRRPFYCRGLGLLLAGTLFFCSALMAGPGGTHTPASGSAERKAIMNAARVPVGRLLKHPVIFKVSHLRVKSGWAFMVADPLHADGRPVDVDRWGVACVLLRRESGRWRVKHWGMASDTGVVDEAKARFKSSPRAIYPGG